MVLRKRNFLILGFTSLGSTIWLMRGVSEPGTDEGADGLTIGTLMAMSMSIRPRFGDKRGMRCGFDRNSLSTTNAG
jgi:hypothetical protein